MQRRAKKQRFTVREFKNPAGSKAWRVAGLRRDGSRVRENYSTPDVAIARQQELLIEFGNDGVKLRPKITSLPDEVIRDAERATAMLPAGRSLVDAVAYFREHYREPIEPADIETAFIRFIDDKMRANRRPATLSNLRQRIGLIKDRFTGYQVNDISTGHLESLLDGRTPTDANNYRRAWSSFFRWAIRKRHREDNPVAGIEKAQEDRQEIALMSVGEAAALLAAAQAHEDGLLVPYVALFLFGGLRHAEIERLPWSKIDFEDGTIRVDDVVAKTRSRRLIEMPRISPKEPPNLLEWLEPYRFERKPFTGPTPALWRRHFDAVKRAAGWKGRKNTDGDGEDGNRKPWVQDIVRHTSISYHLALTQHEGRTATWAGNSPNVVHLHYKGLVKSSEAQAFWKLRPGNVKANVVKIKEAA